MLDDEEITVGSGVPEKDASRTASEPYCVYTRKEKWVLVTMVALGGLLSPLPANIYFPVIPTLTAVFHQSVEDLNQTITIYLAVQGLSPMLWGPLSDRFGRRPVYLLCLCILMLSSIALALCPPSAYWLLLILRVFQSGGCASTIALGAGLIGDIATNEERGGYFGMFNLGPMIAPCIGPPLGGVISDHLGWRSIFWFLAIFTAVCWVLILCFLPETLRSISGNGSIRPEKLVHQPLIPVVRLGTTTPSTALANGANPKKLGTANPFPLLIYPDISLTLSYTGIVYAVNYTITATISSSFADIYPYLSDTDIGLCYLATGAGMIIGSTVTGKLLDWEYARIKKEPGRKEGQSMNPNNNSDFPIEYARLRTMPIHLLVFVGCVLAWGWCLQRRVHLTGPLILQVVLGYTSISILNATMTLMIDIVKNQSSGVIACTNFVRCSLAAILVSVIDKCTTRLGMGWTYALLALVSALLLPLMLVELKFGSKWRMKRDRMFEGIALTV